MKKKEMEYEIKTLIAAYKAMSKQKQLSYGETDFIDGMERGAQNAYKMFIEDLEALLK